MKSFFSQAWLYFKGEHSIANIQEYLLLETGYPFFTLLFYCFLASFSYQTNDLSSWVIGNSFLLCINISIFRLGNTFSYERAYKRIRSIIAAPRSKFICIIEKSLFPIIMATIIVLLGFIAASSIFHLDLHNLNLLYFIIVIFSGIFSISCFGIFLSTIGLMSHNLMHLILNCTQYILMIFTGAEFPISQLPWIGQKISLLLPLTRSIQATNGLFQSREYDLFFRLVFFEILLGLLYCLLGGFLIKYSEYCTRKSGKYDFY